MNAEQLSKIVASIFQDASVSENVYDGETSVNNNQTFETDDKRTVYYWTANGEVVHKNKNCRYLKNSKEIESGDSEEAHQNGKIRECSACFKD